MNQGASAAPGLGSGHPGTADVAPIDLQQFCADEDHYRPHLQRPFRYKGHVYATNGRVLIRVDDDERFELCEKIAVEKVLKIDDPRDYVKAPPVNLPPKQPIGEVDCTACNGRGYEHDCPDCECECEACDGDGTLKEQPEVSADFAGQLFNVEYLRLLYTLPDLEIAPNAADQQFAPMFFRFTGGVGAVMPLSRPYKEHVDISPRRHASALKKERRTRCP